MEKNDYIVVQVTKTYLVTPEQAKDALRKARAHAIGTVFHFRDPDGTELQVSGDDYLRPDGTPDVAAAIADIPNPSEVIGVEEVQSVSHILTPEEVDELTERWRDNEWMNRGGSTPTG